MTHSQRFDRISRIRHVVLITGIVMLVFAMTLSFMPVFVSADGEYAGGGSGGKTSMGSAEAQASLNAMEASYRDFYERIDNEKGGLASWAFSIATAAEGINPDVSLIRFGSQILMIRNMRSPTGSSDL